MSSVCRLGGGSRRARGSGTALASWTLLLLLAATGRAGAQSDHAYTTANIQTGMKLYSGQCQLCHGQNGDTVQGINLRRSQFRRPLSDDDLRRTIVIGVPATGMPPFKFDETELDGLVAFIRAGFDACGLAVKVGDAAKGLPLFGREGCTTCHRVNGLGPRLAPDLSDIGALRSPAQIFRSITDPPSQMMPINRPVRIVLRSGPTVRGKRLNEDSYTVQLIDDKETLVSIDKADIKEIEIGKTSSMPSAAKSLTADELADLVAYLLSLRGQP